MELTGAEIIVEGLKMEGVKYVFGMSATAALPLLDVFLRTPEIRYIQSQHEQGAMYMANGYARATGKTGICLVGPGPGITNCQSGAGPAYYSSVPTLLIGIEDNTRFCGLGAAMHHDLDTVSVMKPVTKLSIKAERAGRLPDLMRMAFRTSLAAKRGPVFLGVPRDVLNEKATVEFVGHDRYRVEQMPTASPEEIAKAAAILLGAKRPVALAGVEVPLCEAAPELVLLAELLGMPVGFSEGNKGIIPEDHPLALGTIGNNGRPYAHRVFQDADAILALGAPFTEFTTLRFEHQVIPKNARIVQIDVDPVDMGKIYPLEMGMVGDIKSILAALTRKIKEGMTGSRPWRENPRVKEFLQQKAAWESEVEPLRAAVDVPIRPYRLMNDLRKALPRDALVVGQSGSTHGWFEYAFESLTHTLDIGSWHPMGSEYCETLGAKLAQPDRTAVCILGDGSLMMTLSEIATAVKYNIPVLTVVRHNDIFGNMRHTQIHRFGGRFLGTDLPIPNLAHIAREFGAYSERVVEPDQIIPAVERALQSGKPAVLEMMVDKSPEWLLPPSR